MHQAIIAKVESIIEIPNAQNIHIAKVLGENCIVSKDVGVGFVGVLFPTDLQLSEDFCKENNLNRKSDLNKDQTKKGFFDDNRKVRAQPFLGVKSTAFFTGLESLDYTGLDVIPSVGFSFNEINGKEICKRYVSPDAARKNANVANNKSRKVNEVPLFMKHKDSEQLKHHIRSIPVGALLSFHSKRHGTSFRVGNLEVVKTLPKWKQIVNKVLPVFKDRNYELVVGTRNVVLKTPEHEGFHGTESFRFEIAEELKPFLTEGMTVYGEITGFVNGRPIMPPHSIKALKDKEFTKKYGESVTYSYGSADHEYKYFVYRITVTGTNGEIYEFPQKHLEAWCSAREIPHTLEIHPQIVYSGDVDALTTICENLTERPDVLCEDYTDPRHISEGIILRVDQADRTDFYKNKSYAFKVCEGILTEPDTEELS